MEILFLFCFDIPGIDTHIFAKISRNSVNSRRATTRYLLSLLAEMAKTWTWTIDDRQRLEAFLKPLLCDHSYGLAPQAFAVAAAARLNDGPHLMTDSVEFLVAS